MMNKGEAAIPRDGIMGCRRPALILLFDDGSSFDYVEGIDLEGLEFYKCRTFEDIEYYLSGVSAGSFRPPSIMGLDIHCESHPDFEMFDVHVELDPNCCGIQLYEHVLRRAGTAFEGAPVIFFTSYSADVISLQIARISKKFDVEIRGCSRIEFRDELLRLSVDMGIINPTEARDVLNVGLSQSDYRSLFDVLADEFELTPSERCSFFGIRSDRVEEIDSLLQISTLANERIDILLAISALLDRFLNQGDKRKFLRGITLRDTNRLAFDLLAGASIQDLLRIKHEIEFRIGGALL